MALNLNKSIPALKGINSSLERMLPESLGQMEILRKNAYDVEFEGISVSIVFIYRILRTYSGLTSSITSSSHLTNFYCIFLSILSLVFLLLFV